MDGCVPVTPKGEGQVQKHEEKIISSDDSDSNTIERRKRCECI